MSDLLANAEILFHELRSLGAAEQVERLAELGVENPELRATVEALLCADRATDELLDRPLRDAVFGELLARGQSLESDALHSLESIAELRRPSQRYRDRTYIGHGGMGTVYCVRDITLHRDLAMKVLGGLGAARVEPSGVLRFIREARVLARLDHPGIVPIHDLGVDEDGRLFFTMKLVRGGGPSGDNSDARQTLEDLLHGFGGAVQGPNHAQVLDILLRVCDALAYAHAHGVRHRDLKPSNIMVGQFGEVYVMDWGLAQIDGDTEDLESEEVTPGRQPGSARATPLTEAGQLLGTPEYMAPEQASGDALDDRADIYSLGAILYRALTGKPPYHHDAQPGAAPPALEVLTRIASGPPPPAIEVAPRAASELSAICARAMARLPDERYSSVNELADDIRAFRADLPGTAWRDRLHVRAIKWVRRHPHVAASALALSIITLVAAVAGVKIAATEARAADLEARRRYDAFASDIERVDRDETLSTSAVQLATHVVAESPQRMSPQDRESQTRRFGSSAREYVGLLAGWNIHIDSNQPESELIREAGTETSEQGRHLIARALYRLVKHLGIAGIAQAAVYRRLSNAPKEQLAHWNQVADDYPDLVLAWSRIPVVLEVLGSQSVGLSSLRAYDRWLGSAQDTLGSTLDFPKEGSDDELELRAWISDAIRGPTEEWASFLDQASEQHPTAFWPHARRLNLAVRRLPNLSGDARRQELDTALFHGGAAVAIWPESRTARMNLAAALSSAGQFDRAHAQLQRILARDPTDEAVWVNEASLFLEQRNWQAAFDAIERAVKLDPSDPDAQLLRGLVYDAHVVATQSDEHEAEAIEAFQTYVELRPTDWQGHYHLGAALQSNAEHARAIRAFDAGLQLHPKGEDLRRSKSESLWVLGRKEEAIELLCELVRDLPKSELAEELLQRLLEDTPDLDARERIKNRVREEQHR
jgi:serine/threonine protein kinase/tetratricopeptide (TPR) repeat protein